MIQPKRVLETAIDVEDVARSREFYERVFGLTVIAGDDARFCALDVGGASVFLLFKEGGTSEPVVLPGGTIPPHGGSGVLHYAFAVDDLGPWEAHFAEQAIEIIGRMRWPRGGESIYFHDPDGHVGEL